MEEQKDLVLFEEQANLEKVQKVIQAQLEEVCKGLNANKEEILEQKRYLWENIYELDPQEIVSNRISISEKHDSYEFREAQKRLLLKLQDNTYFGRIDFIYDGEDEPETIYVGLGGLQDKSTLMSYVFDWRAPISSMYYDFDVGDAYYDAPMGRINGRISQKRQLKVRKGKLEYAFISDYKVDDEILQKELSGSGNIKMRNIVATIQKEQNAIVRDLKSSIMVVQGVAGSGKTSIALHRIAFLLYQNRNDLSSSDVLIISPNNIFADYISNVLPELGEQNISEVSFDEIAEHEMKGIMSYETKYEQIEYVINCAKESDKRLVEIRFKNSLTFLNEIIAYVEQLDKSLFNFTSFNFQNYTVGKDRIEVWYNQDFKSKPIFERIEMIAERVADCYGIDFNVVVSKKSRNEIKQAFMDMASTTEVVALYKNFIAGLTKKYDVLANDVINHSFLLYEDVFPVILLKYLLYGRKSSNFVRIKHVIVDEMQDYTMVQYEILNQLFKCKMTILGDINQVVDKYNDDLLQNIQEIFQQNTTLIKLLKSYRSTYEIGEFCRKLSGLKEAESFERHGREPLFAECSDYADMINKIQDKMDSVDLSKVTTAVVVCKSASSASKLYQTLDDEHKAKCYLMNRSQDQFKEGIIVTNSYLVKGLEFDCVIVPEVTDVEYSTERDRQVLYISCTRALHELDIYYYGKRSKFLDRALC